MTLEEILELGPGAVVELNREVSEPIDLVVGDRIVARGEVVVLMAILPCESRKWRHRN